METWRASAEIKIDRWQRAQGDDASTCAGAASQRRSAGRVTGPVAAWGAVAAVASAAPAWRPLPRGIRPAPKDSTGRARSTCGRCRRVQCRRASAPCSPQRGLGWRLRWRPGWRPAAPRLSAPGRRCLASPPAWGQSPLGGLEPRRAGWQAPRAQCRPRRRQPQAQRAQRRSRAPPWMWEGEGEREGCCALGEDGADDLGGCRSGRSAVLSFPAAPHLLSSHCTTWPRMHCARGEQGGRDRRRLRGKLALAWAPAWQHRMADFVRPPKVSHLVGEIEVVSPCRLGHAALPGGEAHQVVALVGGHHHWGACGGGQAGRREQARLSVGVVQCGQRQEGSAGFARRGPTSACSALQAWPASLCTPASTFPHPSPTFVLGAGPLQLLAAGAERVCPALWLALLGLELGIAGGRGRGWGEGGRRGACRTHAACKCECSPPPARLQAGPQAPLAADRTLTPRRPGSLHSRRWPTRQHRCG